MKKIKDICELLNGYSFKSTNYIKSGYRVLRITNVQKGKIEDKNPVFYKYNSNLSKYELKRDDLLISLTGNVGRVGLVTDEILPSYLNQRVACLRVKSEILPKYLYYILNTIKFENDCIKASNGVAQLNLSTEWLKDYEVKVPSLEIQRDIVKRMNILESSINIRNNQIEHCDSLIKSQFIDMFGDPINNSFNWPVDEIGNVSFVTKLAGFEYSEYINYQTSGDVIMIRGLNVKDKKLKLDDVYYISKDVSDSLPRSQLHSGDICMTYVGVNIGDVALVDDKNYYHLAPNVAKISLHDNCNINSLFFVTLLAYNKHHFAISATNTAKQALNMEKIRKLKVMIPPIDLQNKFASIANKIEKQKIEFENSLKKLEEVREALIQKYFS